MARSPETDGRPEEPFLRRAEQELTGNAPPDAENRAPAEETPLTGDVDEHVLELDPPSLDPLRVHHHPLDPLHTQTHTQKRAAPPAIAVVVVLVVSAILLGIWAATTGRLERTGPVQSPQQLPGVEDAMEPGSGNEF